MYVWKAESFEGEGVCVKKQGSDSIWQCKMYDLLDWFWNKIHLWIEPQWTCYFASFTHQAVLLCRCTALVHLWKGYVCVFRYKWLSVSWTLRSVVDQKSVQPSSSSEERRTEWEWDIRARTGDLGTVGGVLDGNLNDESKQTAKEGRTQA